ncbi:MAG: 50S ribosome-binding GTPase, partial [Clostridiales Family XIII bacterium]|nr:50S ribosome-binding GTPase [Clostridiales Family XIII bacterium]
MDKKITIALIGNPNSGKTTMFNDITGSSQYVGNWPGVTVEKKEGKLRKHKDVLIQDLPGVYSLSPYTPEEVVTRDYLIDVRPDAVINIIDATNIERSLYLTTQVLEANLPTVIALNMMDVADKQGIKVNTEELSKRLGCPVVKMSAIRSEGIMDAAKLALKLAHDNAGRGAGANAAKAAKNAEMQFSEEIETIISEIQDITRADRYTAIKLFERDEPITKRIFADVPSKVTEKSASLRIDEIIEIAETRHDEESEFIIT